LHSFLIETNLSIVCRGIAVKYSRLEITATMEYTTIRVPTSVRDELIEARLSHETSYGQTIERLLGSSSGGQLWTEDEIKDIVTTEIERAQRY